MSASRPFLVPLLLALLVAPPAVASGVILEGRNRVDTTIQADEGRADIAATVAYRVWTLMGEPVVACAVKWELKRLTIAGRSYEGSDDPGRIARGAIPLDVWRKASVRYGHARVQPVGRAESFVCDLGVFGPPDGRSVSYNTPGSPHWNRFLLDPFAWSRLSEQSSLEDLERVHERHALDEPKAKRLARDLKRRSRQGGLGSVLGYSIDFQVGMVAVRLDLHAIRHYLDEQERPALTGRRSAPDIAGNVSAPSPVAGSGVASSGPAAAPPTLEAALDQAQRRVGSDADALAALGPALAPLAKVSKVVVPEEPSVETASHSVLLLVDTSGSMGGRRIAEARAAAKDVVATALRQGGEVAVLGFSGDCDAPVPQRHPFSRNARSLNAFIDALTAGGGTPMSAAIEYANLYMALNRSPASGSEMILLLADGGDACGIMSPVIDSLKADGILVRHQTVGLEVGAGPAARDLLQLARASGGDYQHAANGRELGESFRRAMQARDMLELLGRFGTGTEAPASATSESREGAEGRMQGILDGFRTQDQ